MAERPEPPKPYETWIEWCLASYGGFGEDERKAYARAELEELRDKVAFWESRLTPDETVGAWTSTHLATTTIHP